MPRKPIKTYTCSQTSIALPTRIREELARRAAMQSETNGYTSVASLIRAYILAGLARERTRDIDDIMP